MCDSPSAIYLSLPALVESLALGLGLLCIIKMHVRYCCIRKAIKERAGRCNQVILRDLALGVDVRLSISYILVFACLGVEIGLGIGFITQHIEMCWILL